MIQTSNGIPGITSTTAESSSSSDIKTTKDQFLQLLLAQLENQDPLQPPDANRFAEQITQFGQLEQLFNLNDTMAALNEQQSLLEKSQAVSLIDSQVTAVSEQMEINEETPAEIGFQLSQAANDVQVDIYDSLGRLVRTINYGAQPGGSGFHEFDGKDEQGKDMPGGVYFIGVTAKTASGVAISANPVVRGQVSGVEFINGEAIVRIGDRTVAMGDISSVSKQNES